MTQIEFEMLASRYHWVTRYCWPPTYNKLIPSLTKDEVKKSVDKLIKQVSINPSIKLKSLCCYEFAVEVANYYAHCYYDLDEPVATDEEYDVLYHLLVAYEKEKNWIARNSPTQRVGGKE